MERDLDALLAEQVAYYRARAGEYDEIYAERGMRDTLVGTLPVRGMSSSSRAGRDAGRRCWPPAPGRSPRWTRRRR